MLFVVSGCGRFAFQPDDCTDCFSLMVQPATWDQARTACRDRGPTSQLATIASSSENAAAATLAATIPFSAADTNTNQRQRMWIGGNSLGDSGAWAWDSGEPFDFTNWRAGEPDQVSEHCLIMLGSQDGIWDNRACETSFEAFLCED